MSTLTRHEAGERARAVHLDAIDVELDLSDARDLDSQRFPVASRFSLTASVPSFFIDFVGDVEAVSIDGESVPFVYADERVVLEAVATDSPIEVEVRGFAYYSRSGEGLHRYWDPEDSRVYVYTQFEPQDARRAWPCFDQPDMKACWRFTVTAPTEWTVVSNGALEAAIPDGDRLTSAFAPTRPLSSYITAVVAGPWAIVDGGTWRGGANDGLEIDVPLRLMCRRSLAPFLDSDDVLEVARAGLDFFHANYGVTYPWGKYDQVFVPEYNLGAMENPGCVTFNESYIRRETPTVPERQKRANTILHEMCHMWFGDLVTPRWWDDLWLKESFAENQGAMAAARATRYTTERESFAVGRKAWAYERDQMPTTHPIAADIPDVAAAKTNFDGITYAKGASVLTQLVAWVGEDAFFEGARLYFRRHAFTSATISDLLDCLEEASGQSLSAWSDAWLRTCGPSVLSARCAADDEGRIREFDVVDESLMSPARPHRLDVGVWRAEEGGLVLVDSFEVRVEDGLGQVDPEGRLDRPGAITEADLVVVNSTDATYAVSRLDARSTETALARIGDCPDLMTRAIVWSSLWNAIRDGILDPRLFIRSALHHAKKETDRALGARLIDMSRAAIMSFLPGSARQPFIDSLGGIALAIVGSGVEATVQRPWIRGLLALVPGSRTDAFLNEVRSLAERDGSETAWLARSALAARGLADRETIERWYALEPTGEAARHRIRALSAIPDDEALEGAWTLIMDPASSNDSVSAALEGLATSAREGLGVLPRALDALEAFWNTRSIGLGIRFVDGALAGGVDIEDEQSVGGPASRIDRWLNTHPQAPAQLRRLVIEHLDSMNRRLRVQRMWS